MLEQKDELSFPSYNDDHELTNDINNFFLQKISSIRSDLDNDALSPPRQDLDADCDCELPFHTFDLLFESDVLTLE